MTTRLRRMLACSSSTTSHRTSGCWRRSSPRGGTTSCTASSGEEALALLDDGGRRPRPARHRDAGDGRLRGVPRDPGAARHGVPAGRDGDGQRRRAEGQGARGRRRRLPHQADRHRASCSPGSRPWPGSSGTRTRSSASLTSSRRGTRSSRRGWRSRCPSSSGWAGCAASCRPQLAELIVDSGDESFLASHRREIVVVFCDLRGFTSFAEASEPEEVMGVLEEYHEALGDLIFRFEGTLERFTGDGLMVFFNDPVRCDDGPARAIRMSVAMRTRVRGLAETWAPAGARPRARDRDRPGLRHARHGSASTVGTTTRRSAA